MSFARAIVVGAGGQVSRALRESLELRGIPIVLTSSSGKGHPMDLGDPASIRAFFAALPPEFRGPGTELFLPGALTHVDRCETERELCRRINTEGPVFAAECAHRHGMGITFFSTEYVFGGAEYEGGAVGPFSEEDPPHPTTWYGQCKLDAEKGILAIDPNALIVRTTMVFSWDPDGLNFFMQLYRQLERGASAPQEFKIAVDQISTPTYAPALAEAVVTLRERKIGGIVNLVGSDLLSRKEFLLKMAEAFGFPSDPPGFRYLETKDLGQKARRPLRAGLRTDKARTLGVKVLSLSEAFRAIADARTGAAQR